MPSNDELSKAMDTLELHLSNNLRDISQHRRTEITGAFNEFKCQLDSTHSRKTHITPGDKRPTYFEKKVLDLWNLTKKGLISHPDSGQPQKHLHLEDELLKALSCFSLFGENAVMKKRELVYWWIGQGLIEFVKDGEDAEVAADKLLRKLVEAGAIEQVICIRKKRVSSKYRLVSISNLQQQIKDHQKVGMLRKEGTKLTIIDTNGTIIDAKSKALPIKTLFNLDVSILYIRRDWLRNMRHIEVLHLGRWSNDNSEKFIEKGQVQFFQSLKHLNHVRFISLKEISRIIVFGEEICSLGKNLRVLDLKACPHLQVLPKGIGKLKNLTHLDLSQCFVLDGIPKGITKLAKLQVLDGFVIHDVDSSYSCKFEDLANHLGKTLRKLSITTRKISFPVEDDLKAFAKFEKLLKLNVVWIRLSDSVEDEVKQEQKSETKDKLFSSRSFSRSLAMRSRNKEVNFLTGLPQQLQKLEVQAIPQTAIKSLLFRNYKNLQNLKKLYIIGGQVFDLTNQGKVKLENVRTMRLKYLTKLHMDWMQWNASFPQVTHLEITQCPYLTFFPVDLDGIWRADENL